MKYPQSDLSRQVVGRLIGANFNSTADQPMTIWVPNGAGGVVITGFLFMNASLSLTTAAGGIYSAASKGGTAILTAATTYAGLTGSANEALVVAATVPWRITATGLIYFSLTTAQGATASADIFVEGTPFYS